MSTPTQLSPTELFAKLSAAALDGAWTLDARRSSVAIATKSVWGLVKVKGEFTDLTGHATVAGDSVTGTISISTASIDTKNAKRDKHLRSEDFFASDSHPAIVFTLTSAKPAAGSVTLDGTLAVRDAVRPVSLDATITLNGDNEITLTTSVDIDRSEYGMSWNQLGMASMSNAIAVTAVFSRG